MGLYSLGIIVSALLLSSTVLCDTSQSQIRYQEIWPKTSESTPKCLTTFDLSITKRICETKNVVQATLISAPSYEKTTLGRLRVIEPLFEAKKWKFQRYLQYSISESMSGDCVKLVTQKYQTVYIITKRDNWTVKDGVITGVCLDDQAIILTHNRVNDNRIKAAFEQCESTSKDEAFIFENPKPYSVLAPASAKYKRDVTYTLDNTYNLGHIRKNHQTVPRQSYAISISQNQPSYRNPKPIKRYPKPVSNQQGDEAVKPKSGPTVVDAPPKQPLPYPKPVSYPLIDPITDAKPIEYAKPNAPITNYTAPTQTVPPVNPQPNPAETNSRPRSLINPQPRPVVNPPPGAVESPPTRAVPYSQPMPIPSQPRALPYEAPNPNQPGYPLGGGYRYPQPDVDPRHNGRYYPQPGPDPYHTRPYYQPRPNEFVATRPDNPGLTATNPQAPPPPPTPMVKPGHFCPFGKPTSCPNYYPHVGFELKSQLCSFHYILLLEVGRVHDVLEETYNRTGISHQCGVAKVIRSQKGFIRNFAPKLFFTNLRQCYNEYLHLKSYILVIANVPSFIQARNGQIVGIKLSENVHILSFTQTNVGEINAILNNCMAKVSQPVPLRFLTADGKKSDYYECPQKNECPKCLENTPHSYEDLYCSSQYATVLALGLDYTYVNANSTNLIFKRPLNISPSIVYEPATDIYASINVQKIAYNVDRDDLEYNKCYRETLRILYDVSYNKLPNVLNKDIDTYIPSKCDCSFLKSDPGYYLVLSKTPIVDPSYNLIQLGEGFVTIPLPVGTLTLPKCRPDYQASQLFAEKNIPITTKPREPFESGLLPKAAPLVPCLGEPTCAHCLTQFTKELEYDYCQADFVYIFKILDEPGIDYQSIYSPEISVASAPTYTKLRIHGSYQHPLGQDEFEPSHRHKRQTSSEPIQCLNGFVYSECAPAPGCEPTCDSFYNIHCYKRSCHKGCVCPEGMVRKENHCVNPQDCVQHSDSGQCYSGKIQILADLKKKSDLGEIVKYFMGGFCSCQYFEYPIGAALIFSRKTPLEKISQLNDDFHIVNLPHGQTDLPNCPNLHHHNHHHNHHHHETLDNYNQFHAHPHTSHPHPKPTTKKTCPLSQPTSCVSYVTEPEFPDSCLFDDVMKIAILKLPTSKECGEVQVLELYTHSKHVMLHFCITMLENCCQISQGEEVILFTRKDKWVVKDAYTSGLILDSEVVLVKHSYKAASQIRDQQNRCQKGSQDADKSSVIENPSPSATLTNQTRASKESKLISEVNPVIDPVITQTSAPKPEPTKPSASTYKENRRGREEKSMKATTPDPFEIGEFNERTPDPPTDSTPDPFSKPDPGFSDPFSKPDPGFSDPFSKPNTGFSDPFSKPDPGFSDPYSKPDPGFSDPYSKPDPGFSDPFSKPDPGFSDPFSKPDPGFSDPFSKPDPGFSDPFSKPDPGFSDPFTEPTTDLFSELTIDPEPQPEPKQDNTGECSTPTGECPQCSTRIANIRTLDDICKIDYILKADIKTIPQAGGGWYDKTPPTNCGSAVIMETLYGEAKDFPADNLISFTMDPNCSCRQLKEGYEVILATMNDHWNKKNGQLYEMKVTGTVGILDKRRYDDVLALLAECTRTK